MVFRDSARLGGFRFENRQHAIDDAVLTRLDSGWQPRPQCRQQVRVVGPDAHTHAVTVQYEAVDPGKAFELRHARRVAVSSQAQTALFGSARRPLYISVYAISVYARRRDALSGVPAWNRPPVLPEKSSVGKVCIREHRIGVQTKV